MKSIYWIFILLLYIVWICVINTNIKKKIISIIICIVLIIGVSSVYGNELAAIILSLVEPFLYSIIVGIVKGKSCYEHLLELTNEYSIVQIDTGVGENKRK